MSKYLSSYVSPSWAVLPLVQKLVLKVKCRRLNWPTQAACKINNPAEVDANQLKERKKEMKRGEFLSLFYSGNVEPNEQR